MIFWRSIAIALAVILGLSYAGFAYIYSLSGVITNTRTITSTRQPKVITLLKNQNITNLEQRSNLFLNTSVATNGYKTGFLYLETVEMESYQISNIDVYFETDNLTGLATRLIANLYSSADSSYSWEINMGGTLMWIRIYSWTSWAVLSMSLYLRD